MIVRRYGVTMQRVTPNFDAHAMNEIGFLRDGGWSLPAKEFETDYERGEVHELTARAQGDVQGAVEEAVLSSLEEQLTGLQTKLGDGEVLVIENQPGTDQAKTRGSQTTLVVEGENRLRFEYNIDPPLRVSVWRPRS